MAAENLMWETRLGIVTRRLGEKKHKTTEHQYYATIAYRAMFRVLRMAELQPDDVLADIGCGKGRVLCCAATINIARVIGIEDVPHLCAIARKNLQQMRGRRAAWEVLDGCAEDFDYSRANVFYLFNPFGPVTMRKMLARVEKLTSQREIKIIYANPAYDSVMAEAPWLERYLTFRPTPRLEPKLWVSLWRSKSEPAQKNPIRSAI